MTFTEMVTRLERLEAENNCLKAELKKASINIDKLRAERELHTTKDRQLIPRINTKTYEKMFKITHINKNARWYRGWQIIRTFILVNISWYFDNAATLTDAFRLMGNTFKHASFSMDAVVKMSGSQLDLIILLAGCLVWLIISILKEKGIVIREALDRKPLIIRWAVYIALVMSVAMLGYISNTSGGFMYAQF